MGVGHSVARLLLAIAHDFRQTASMSESILSRKLWYVDGSDRVCVDQTFLQTDLRPLIVLGEAGMGKSTLLAQLKNVEGHAYCTARKLINATDPEAVLGKATTLIIDALDEVSTHRDGDAVDQVLRKLGLLRNPRFIISCRVADWRSATALQGIADFYDKKPLELHLEPLTREDAITFLEKPLGETRAKAAIEHLESRGLSGLWSNPQTLELVAKVASSEEFPDSKGDLFTQATRLLCLEHREEKGNTALAALSETKVLDAAGAAFAALIITGKDAVSRLVNSDADDVPIREVATLPAASNVFAVLDSRLLAARSTERFSYTHRAIGEFLGARWLARNAETPRKQRRLLELFGNQSLVPASLRGIYAWLAWHSTALAPQVIATDPMGIVEYGDADKLSPAQARALFAALRTLSRENPRFRDWTEYRVGGLVQEELLSEVRQVLTDPNTEFGLRLLVLQALEGSSLINELEGDLRTLLLDSNESFTNRREAGKRITALETPFDFPEIIKQLLADNNGSSLRLAGRLMIDLGFERFDDALILDVVLAQLERGEDSRDVYFIFEQQFPTERLDTLLSGICSAAPRMGHRHERIRNPAITDLAYTLLSRRLESRELDSGQLWAWLEPFYAEAGYHRDAREAVAQFLSQADSVRRAIQRHVLLNQPGDETVLQRHFSLLERSSGFEASDEDVVALLEGLEPNDARWRDLVHLVPHGIDKGTLVRAAALRFVTGRSEDADWLAQIAETRVPQWQIERERRLRKQRKKRDRRWQQDRVHATEQLAALQAGEFDAVIRPALAYLNLFADLGDEADDGPARLEQWLGPDLRQACLAGFEAFLTLVPPNPTATDIAESHAEGRHWNAAYIIVAGLAERLRTGRGFGDLSDERLLAGFFEVRHTGFPDDTAVGTLNVCLAEEIRRRGAWERAQRLYFEPQLSLGCAHISGLYDLMHDTVCDEQLSGAFALEWLERFPDMAMEPETELVDRSLATAEGRAALRRIVSHRRRSLTTNDDRRRNWDAVGLIVDFDATSAALEQSGGIERNLFWSVRARLGHRRYDSFTARLDCRQLAWMIRTFRPLYPAIYRPTGVTTGETNPWDATEHMGALIKRLGDDISDEAIEALTMLKDSPTDGYSELLRVSAAEQKRKRVEADWVAPDFSTIAAATTDAPPTTPARLQEILLEEMGVVQDKVRGSDVDWYRDFLHLGVPRIEEDCRDTILKMLRPLPFDIQAAPEGHLGDDKRCDIICTLADAMVPIEIKGQPSLPT